MIQSQNKMKMYQEIDAGWFKLNVSSEIEPRKI